MTTITTILGEKLLNGNRSAKIDTDELKEKTIGLYFSAQWCDRCRNFTSKLVQVYNDPLIKNNSLPFDIVFISADDDQESFDEYYQDMPWKAIPFENRDHIEMLNNYYQIQDIPSLIILKPDGELLTLNGDEEFRSINTIERWANGQTIFWTREAQNDNENIWTHINCNACFMKPIVGLRFGCPDRECGYDLCQECYLKGHEHNHELIEFLSPKKTYSIEQIFDKSTLIDRDDKCITIKSLENKYIGLYFSASWSMSDSNMTSDLIEIYLKTMVLNLPFDIIFISGDCNQINFDKLHKEMPWKALPLSNQIINLQLKTYFSVTTIPALIVLKPNGELLTKSGRNDIEKEGFEAVLSWCKGEKVRLIPEEFVWSSIICDGCGMTPLIGKRFYCDICSNYDLCLACKEKGHEHVLILIPQPDNYEEN